ncbi:hypothetical protein BGZ46_007517 [Entomortierella lignicola]|nr:hypothetical protein BGZ46_007517 [Entomortierella lignicola]
MEHSYQEQQQRQYENYEQQSRYYRETAAPCSIEQDSQQTKRPAQYRHSTYHDSYSTIPLPHPSHDPRQQQAYQLQSQRRPSLGPLPSSRLCITREQLPTAPSPPINSATQLEPDYHEHIVTESVANLSDDSTLDKTCATDLPPISEASISRPISESYVSRPSNRGSVYSAYLMRSPIVPERLIRTTSEAQDSKSRRSSIGVSQDISAVSIARSSSDPSWNSLSSLSAPSASRSSQNQSYSRQVTLSSIPPDEGVPPMPGRTTSKTGKVRIQITFDKPFFNSGGELSGRVEMQCSSSNSIKFADMIIELLGYEAPTKDYPSPKVFHKTILRLQDARRPSQAVQENISPDTLPSSYDSKLGQVRYVTSAIARMKSNQQKEIVNHTREVFIYETWTTDDVISARKKSVKADTSKRLFMGGEGSLEMYAELTRTMVSAGGIVYVNVGVKNLTKKKIMGIKLTLWRHIATSKKVLALSSPVNRDQDSVKNYSEIIYKGDDYAFDNDDPRMIVLPIYIPSGVYSLRNASYLHVQFFVQVSLMASMSKALAVELPIYITHPSSWSDPPPRIPRDFAFPTHEQDPIKKNKTGVFSKKKSSPMQSSGPSNNLKTSPGKNDSNGSTGGSARNSFSAPSGQINALTMPQGNTRDGACSHPNTRRSSLKDPDSPTSVLEFSQAGNLFVVNPDAASLHRASDSSSLLLPEPIVAAHPAASPYVLQTESVTPVTPYVNSIGSSPILPSTATEILAPKALKAIETTYQYNGEEEDFDMSRSISPSQINAIKKEQEKAKSGKMGLRKTLAKLSIAIPNQGLSSADIKQASHISPKGQVTTPHSEKSTSMESPEDISPGETRSPGRITPLSRTSSGSSLRSFKLMLESISRKSSAGSTRVVTVSPGPMSPGQSSLKMTKYSSQVSSPTLSSKAEDTSISGLFDEPSQVNVSPSERQPDWPYVRQSAPSLAVHEGTPVVEEKGSEGYFDSCGSENRTPTSSSSGIKVATGHSSPSTPNSFTKPWELQRNFSNSSISSSLVDSYDGVQTAKGVRDEYYFGKNATSRRNSTESLETKIVPPLTYDPIVADSNMYDIPEISNDNIGVDRVVSLSEVDDQGHYDEANQHPELAKDQLYSNPRHDINSLQQTWHSGQSIRDVDENQPFQPNRNLSTSILPERNQAESSSTQPIPTQEGIVSLDPYQTSTHLLETQQVRNDRSSPDPGVTFSHLSQLQTLLSINTSCEKATNPQLYTPQQPDNLKTRGTHHSCPTSPLFGISMPRNMSYAGDTKTCSHPEPSVMPQITISRQFERSLMQHSGIEWTTSQGLDITKSRVTPLSDYNPPDNTTAPHVTVPSEGIDSIDDNQSTILPTNMDESRNSTTEAITVEQPYKASNHIVPTRLNTYIYHGVQTNPGRSNNQHPIIQQWHPMNAPTHHQTPTQIQHNTAYDSRGYPLFEPSFGPYEDGTSYFGPQIQPLLSHHTHPVKANLCCPGSYVDSDAKDSYLSYRPRTQYIPNSPASQKSRLSGHVDCRPPAAHDISQMSIAVTYGSQPATVILEQPWSHQLVLPATLVVDGSEPSINSGNITTLASNQTTPNINAQHQDTQTGGNDETLSNITRAISNESSFQCPSQSIVVGPVLSRINGTFRPSPLTFKGNVITAAEPSPPPPPRSETSICITSNSNNVSFNNLLEKYRLSPTNPQKLISLPPNSMSNDVDDDDNGVVVNVKSSEQE